MKSFDRFRVDFENKSLWHGEVRVPLMPKPFAVLQYLVERPGRLVTHDQLLKAVWPETHVQADVLRRYIMEIRRALGDRPAAPRFIQTFPKRGFQFIAPVTDDPVAAPTAALPSLTRLVGRMAALTELERHLIAALNSRRQIVFVVGEPGIGKTSLIDAFQRHASTLPNMRVARGHSIEGFGSKEPYYPVLEALGQLAQSDGSAPIVETLARHAPTWMIQFRSLIREDQRAALQREIVGATRERMVRELCEALELVTQTVPMILVLEDLHWADHSTLDFVSALARRRAPAKLLVVGTFRPGDVIASDSPLKELSHDLTLHRLSHEVMLDRLTESDVAEYLTPVFAPGQLPEGLPPIIHRHSDGNPLFMTAMLDHLDQQGVLSRGPLGWTLAVPLDRIDPGVPETLRQMLEMQLEQLTDSQRRLLQCASVAGQNFTAWAVATMLVRDPAAVEQDCQLLADQEQFLKLSGTRTLANGALTLEYQFKHVLYREVLYRRIYPNERVNFHRRLAEGLESLRSPVDAEMAAQIAVHFEAARKFEEAVRYSLMAAESATRRRAYLESIGVLEHAVTLLPEVAVNERAPLESQLLERIGDAQYTIGDVERSIQTYDTMAANAADANLPVAEATALMRVAHPAAFVDSSRCIRGCERASAIGAAIGNETLETHARLLTSCWRIMNQGWRRQDAESCAKSIAKLRLLGAELPPYDQILYARVQIFQSKYAEACDSVDRAMQHLNEAHALWVRAKAISTKANALLFWGRLGDAYRTVTAGIELAKRNENAPWLGILLATLGWLKWEMHDFAGLEALTLKVEEFARATHGPQMWLRATSNVAGATMRTLQGFADIAAGRHDRALQRFATTTEQKRPYGLSWQRRMFAQVGAAEAWLALGDFPKASAEADRLVQSVLECGDAYLRARAFELRARVALADERSESARRYIRQGLDVITVFDVPLAAWRVHATAWEALRETDASEAEFHRSYAERGILELAKSLNNVEPLRRSFLSAPGVRRVLGGELLIDLSEIATPPLGQPS